MSLRWDPDEYDALESHGQDVPGSLDWYEGWDGLSPERRELLTVLEERREILASLSSRMLVAPEGSAAGSSPARGHRRLAVAVAGGRPACVVCNDHGCEFCPKVSA